MTFIEIRWPNNFKRQRNWKSEAWTVKVEVDIGEWNKENQKGIIKFNY